VQRSLGVGLGRAGKRYAPAETRGSD
jgi:hypothetical protein